MTNINTSVYIALAHHPVYNKNMEVVTTSVTNLDLHDISRTATTYAVKKYYVVHPSPNHQQVINNVINYWHEGYGGIYNPDRKTAFGNIILKNTLEEVIGEIEQLEGKTPKLVATDARVYPNTITFKGLRDEIHNSGQPFLILFGTGWGLIESVMNSCNYILEPIRGVGDYNHLSVRAAVAIILDRLLSVDN